MRLDHLILASCLTLTATVAPAPRITQHAPRLTMDLKSVGFAPSRYDTRERRYLAFNEAGQILFAANLRDESRIVSNFHTTVLVLNPADGVVLYRATIPHTNRHDEFFLISRNRLLFCDNEKISVYSPALTLERQVDLPPDFTNCTYQSISPNLTRFGVWGPSQDRAVVSSDDLSVVANPCSPQEIPVLGDTLFSCVSRWPMRVWVTGSHPPRYYGEDMVQSGNAHGFFSAFYIGDDALLIATGKEFSVFDRNGHAIFQATSEENFSFQMLASIAPSAHRFAQITQSAHGFDSELMAFQWFERRVAVYDFRSRSAAPVFTEQLETDGPWVSHRSDVALSRDGKHLALLTDTTLRLYDLP
jgi:hypothetical protein